MKDKAVDHELYIPFLLFHFIRYTGLRNMEVRSVGLGVVDALRNLGSDRAMQQDGFPFGAFAGKSCFRNMIITNLPFKRRLFNYIFKVLPKMVSDDDNPSRLLFPAALVGKYHKKTSCAKRKRKKSGVNPGGIKFVPEGAMSSQALGGQLQKIFDAITTDSRYKDYNLKGTWMKKLKPHSTRHLFAQEGKSKGTVSEAYLSKIGLGHSSQKMSNHYMQDGYAN